MKWIRELHVRAKTTKLVEECLGEKFIWPGIEPFQKRHKKYNLKIHKFDFIKIKKSLLFKRHCYKNKKANHMLEKILAAHIATKDI